MEQQIDNLISAKVGAELDALIVKLQATQSAFMPIMQSVRETFQAMGGGAKDVRQLIKAVDDYNKIMGTGTTTIREYNSVQAQIAQMRKKLTDLNKDELLTLERLKEQSAANTAEVKKQVAAEAELAGRRKSSATSDTDATRAKVRNREETRRLTNEIRRQLDVENGVIKTSKGSETSYRAKDAMLKMLIERYKDASSTIAKTLLPQIQRLDKELKKQDAQLGRGTRKVGLYENFGRGLASIFPTGAQIASLGVLGGSLVAAATAARALYSAFKYGIKVNMEFEASNATLATILGTTSRNIEQLKQQSLELGRTTEYTAVQVTNAQTELAKLGFSQSTILNMTKPLLGFATALDASLPAAAQVAGQALRAFNLSSSNTEQVLTEMTLAANKSAMDFAFLERSIAIVGASASVAKVPLKDTLALLGVLSNSGLDASRAATALRNIFLYLADDSKKLGKAMKGTEMNAASIAKGFTELRNKGVDLADMFQLTDKRAVNALAVLIQNSDQIIKLRNEIQATTGALDEIRNIRLDTMLGDTKLLSSAWDAYWLSFRENMPFWREFIQGATSILSGAVKRRTQSSYGDMGSQSFGINRIDEGLVNYERNRVEKELASLNEAYKQALSNDTDVEANKIYKQLLDKRAEYIRKYAKDYKASGDRVIVTTESIDRELLRLTSNVSGNAKAKNIYRDMLSGVDAVTKGHEELRKATENLDYTQKSSADLQNKLATDITDTERKEYEKRLVDNKKLTEKFLSNIEAARKKVASGYATLQKTNATPDFKASGLDATIRTFASRALETEARAYGRYLTQGAIKDAVEGLISEEERTMVEQATSGSSFTPDNGRAKRDKQGEKRKDILDAEELAAYTLKINILKGQAEEQKTISETEANSWDVRRKALEEYIAILEKVEKLEYERSDAKLRQQAIEGSGYSATNVPDKNVLDPVTGAPQTEVEKATLKQRQSLYYNYTSSVLKLRGDLQQGVSKLNKAEQKDEEDNVKAQLETFKEGLKERLKGVEQWGANEKLKLARLFKAGKLNDTDLKDQTAFVDVQVAEQMGAQTALYYETFIDKLGLPEELRTQLMAVFNEHKRLMETGITEAEADYEKQTGKDYSSSKKGSKRRSIFGSTVKRAFGGRGAIDEEASSKAGFSSSVSKGITDVLNSKEVQVANDIFNQLTDVATAYYDNEIEKIDELMSKKEEQYEREKALLDEKLSHLEFNNSAGLVSEDNYLAQKRKNDAEQRLLDKKRESEQDALEAKKRKIQLENAKWQKRQSYTSAVMSTAQGIASALTIKPTPLGIILASIVGAMGAAQVSLIASQQIPQYAKGTKDHVGGLMMVGDGGKHEVVLEPTGRTTITPKTPTYMEAPAHTQVFKDENAFLSYLAGTRNTDTDGKRIDVHIDNTGDPEQRSLLRSVNKKLDRLNANEVYRIRLERHNKQFQQW